MDHSDVLRLQSDALISDAFLALEAEVVLRLCKTYPHLNTESRPKWLPIGWDLTEMNAGNRNAIKGFEGVFLDSDRFLARHMIVRILPGAGIILVLNPVARYIAKEGKWDD